jgi:membrane-associated phospholipid phosphatase
MVMDRTLSRLLCSLPKLFLLLVLAAPLASCFQPISSQQGSQIPSKNEIQTLPFRRTNNSPIGSRSHKHKASPSDQETSSDLEAVNNSASLTTTEKSLAEMAFSAVGSTTSAVVSVVFFAVLAWKRDAFMVSFFLGSIGNGILSKVLKKLLNQSRPEALQSVKMKLKPSDGGMPSSHAMSLGFIATFTTISLIPVVAPWSFGLLWIYVAVSLAYRVQVNLHTWQQVVVGLITGASNGWMWHTGCHAPVMDWVATYFLNADGVLPLPLLVLPALIGAVIVGSFERRISAFLKSSEKEE